MLLEIAGCLRGIVLESHAEEYAQYTYLSTQTANELVEKASCDIAPVMGVLQDHGVEILWSEVRDGPLQANRYESEVLSCCSVRLQKLYSSCNQLASRYSALIA